MTSVLRILSRGSLFVAVRIGMLRVRVLAWLGKVFLGERVLKGLATNSFSLLIVCLLLSIQENVVCFWQALISTLVFFSSKRYRIQILSKRYLLGRNIFPLFHWIWVILPLHRHLDFKTSAVFSREANCLTGIVTYSMTRAYNCSARRLNTTPLNVSVMLTR